VDRESVAALARDVIGWCRALALCSEDPRSTTRTFLSPPMHEVHSRLGAWMARLGMRVRIDQAGNLRAVRPATVADAPRLFIGSHLDTVPGAGAFDGILGVVIGAALVELGHRGDLPFSIEIVGFSDEEGVRFGVPFIGSRAFVGALDDETLGHLDAEGLSVRDAIAGYGLDPSRLDDARVEGPLAGYLEFHIEQGPILAHLGLPLGVVETIVGQSRLAVTFSGSANHAGTTPMDARHDAIAGAAEWIVTVEAQARQTPALVATVGQVQPWPGATNVIAGRCVVSLDVRHPDDDVRRRATERLIDSAGAIAARRRLHVASSARLDQPAVAMDAALAARLDRAVAQSGLAVHRMSSGAGHDAMIVAARMPAAMLFLRSPGGISHHPDETVLEEDVAAAIAVGKRFLDDFMSAPHD
jgi:allantoate deiminase